MALGGKSFELIFELYKKNFFKNINSVLDMGDQDLNINYNKINDELKQVNISIRNELLNVTREYPKRPRLSTSVLWNAIGIKNLYRLDLRKIERNKYENFSKFIIHDLNYPYDFKKNSKYYCSFDLVTDFGNNEHPFNVSETYKTMHNFVSKNGYLWIEQSLYGGNGFYNFDKSYFLNLAAVNNYTINYSCMYFVFENEILVKAYNDQSIKEIDLNKVESINIILIMQKNDNLSFNYPYQGTGKNVDKKEIYSLKESHNFDTDLLEYLFLPKSVEEIKTKILFKTLIKRLFKKFLKKNEKKII